jgi:hypothetical protein
MEGDENEEKVVEGNLQLSAIPILIKLIKN